MKVYTYIIKILVFIFQEPKYLDTVTISILESVDLLDSRGQNVEPVGQLAIVQEVIHKFKRLNETNSPCLRSDMPLML